MFPLVVLADVRLSAKSRRMNFEFGAGTSWAVMGPGEPSALFDVIAKVKRPQAGNVNLGGPIVESGGISKWRKSLMDFAKQLPLGGDLEAVAEALAVLHLWDSRRLTLDQLDRRSTAHAALLPLFLAAPGSILLCNQHLDALDPWVLPGVLDFLTRRLKSESVLLAWTSRPDIAESMDNLLVFHRQEIAFAGSVEELIARGGQEAMTIRVGNEPIARALVKPFQVEATSSPGGELQLLSPANQDMAAHLLSHGYGNVELVQSRPKTLEEALRDLPLI